MRSRVAARRYGQRSKRVRGPPCGPETPARLRICPWGALIRSSCKSSGSGTRLSLRTPRPSLGDERIFADTLLDKKGSKVGHDAGVCTFTSLAPPEAACQITFFLSGGEISTQFLNAPPPRKLAAIVGGTGAYRGARGEAVIVEGPHQTGTVTFSLTR